MNHGKERKEEEIQDKIKKLLIVGADRIFIDVADFGCGNGCKYCYVESAKEEQRLADYSDLDAACDFILKNRQSLPDIVSFCPRTEPFKSLESSQRVIYVMRRLAEMASCFQISTKEEISAETIEELGAVSGIRPVFLNVSIPVLGAERLEPFAAKPSARIKNIIRIQKYPNLYGGLYIKPLLKETLKSAKEYSRMIHLCTPDYVCVGVQFTDKNQTPCISLYDEEKAQKLIYEQAEELFRFSSEINQSADCIMVYSSVCAINQILKKQCCLKLWQYQPECCKFCKLKPGG